MFDVEANFRCIMDPQIYNVKYLFSYSTQQQQQSGMFQGNLPSYNNSTISFARSFAQFPPNRPSNQELSTTVELNTIDMSLDALYIHELHHMEVSASSNCVPMM
jgi:hypothetical protein